MPKAPSETDPFISPYQAFPTAPANTQIQDGTPARIANDARRCAQELGLGFHWLILLADGANKCRVLRFNFRGFVHGHLEVRAGWGSMIRQILLERCRHGGNGVGARS
jgi:hypothetical protein